MLGLCVGNSNMGISPRKYYAGVEAKHSLNRYTLEVSVVIWEQFPSLNHVLRIPMQSVFLYRNIEDFY